MFIKHVFTIDTRASVTGQDNFGKRDLLGANTESCQCFHWPGWATGMAECVPCLPGSFYTVIVRAE